MALNRHFPPIHAPGTAVDITPVNSGDRHRDRRNGHLTLTFQPSTPAETGWYQDYTAPLLYKPVTGDFLAITRVTARHVDNAALAPDQSFNSAGFMVRDPDSITGDQDWLMYNVGYQCGFVGTEGKTTENSSSVLTLIPTAGRFSGRLAVCRAGSSFRMFRYLDGETGWTETNAYVRNDLPQTLDVGLLANAWEVPASIRAEFDYIRLSVPADAAACSTASLNAQYP